MADNTDVALAEPEEQESPVEEQAENADPLEGNEELQKALYGLYLKCCSEDRYARLVEVRDVQKRHFYWRNLQYLWWSEKGECWNTGAPVQGNAWNNISLDDMPRFEFVTNIYQAFGLSLIAVLSQAPPRIRWFPEDAEEPKDIETAEGYTKIAKMIERWNPIQVMMQDEAFNFWNDGVIGGWTRYIADGERFGFETIEDLNETQEQQSGDELRCPACGFSAPMAYAVPPVPCPQCGQLLTADNVAPGQTAAAPTSAGEEQVPRGRQVITIAGALNLKRPQFASEQAEFHYLGYEKEVHYSKLRAAHPEVADKIKPGGMIGEDSTFERNARLSTAEGTRLYTQTGNSQASLTTYARVWFRPTAFWMLPKADRDQLLEIFPRGCRVHFAGDVYCESAEESMDDCWRVEHAMPGDGQHRPALGSTLMSVQDRFNTFTNIAAETYEYGIPITYRDAGTFDDEANDDQRAEPGSEVPVVLKGADDIRSKIMQVRSDSASPDMMKHMMDLMGPVAQFLTGAFPALFGGGEAGGAAGDTASGYSMQRDQAMGRMGISYVRLKQFHADMMSLSCEDFCKHATGKQKMPILGPSGDFESESVDVDALEGNARAYPEGDENYPVLWSQQRATFMQVMDSPQGQALMTEPDNAEMAVKLIGIPGLVIPGADARKKALRTIGELTEAQDGMSQEMSPEQIAALIDNDLDDHAAEGATGKHWLMSDAGLKCGRENPTGRQNVRNWTLMHLKAVPPPPPPEKPLAPSLSVAFKDMPPEAQAQVLKQFGIDVSPQDFIAGMMLAKAKNAKPTLPTQGQGGPPPNPGIPG